MTLDEAKRQLVRRAIQMEIGGFTPPENPASSWFGRVNLAGVDETWPFCDGKPMHALCQLNIGEMPFPAPGLEDIGFVTVFIGADKLPCHSPNGADWCLRTYPSTKSLVPLERVDSGSVIKPFAMRPRIIEEDYPCWEDVNIQLPDDLDDAYFDHFENVGGLKLGGWATLVQAQIFWAPWNRHPAVPEYVFQIDSTDKGNWMWGDSGVGYFGRGTAKGHTDEWACEWQCY